MKTEFADIPSYNAGQTPEDRAVCDLLQKELGAALGAESKLWHGHPVWFLDGNPIAGYAKRKHGVTLLFWSGRSFDEPALLPEGTFQAAEAKYGTVADVDIVSLRRWLAKAREIQWDYRNIVKRRGVLVRLNP